MSIMSYMSFLALATVITAQVCDDTGVSRVFHSDITRDNGSFEGEITLSGDPSKGGIVPVLDLNGITLTDSSAGNYGGFFFDAPVAFQGDGGFSAKFALLATGGSSGGEGWEFIVASTKNRGFEPPPFGVGSPSNGLGGWSRTNAMVIEFDTLDTSGADEQDNVGAGSHVSMYLNGAKICQDSVGNIFDDGDKHFVWVDFIGFSTTMQIRLSTLNSRPNDPTVECGIDMWGSMSIQEDNHIGFGAFNPPQTGGAVHTLTDSITFSDAYRPIDTDDECAFYTECALRTTNSLCTTFKGNGTCDYRTCDPVYAWTIGGGSCCSFIEKRSYRSTGNEVDIVDGGNTTCERQRVTVVQQVDSALCDGGVTTTEPSTTAPIEAATDIATAAVTDATTTAIAEAAITPTEAEKTAIDITSTLSVTADEDF